MAEWTERGQFIEDGLNELYFDSGNLLWVIGQYDRVLADHARYMQQHGISYRDFLVGGCAVVLAVAEWAQELNTEAILKSTRPAGEIMLLSEANNTPFKGARRQCPELKFAAQSNEIALEHGRAIMAHVYTRGPYDRDEIASVTGVPLDTLPFCYTCGPEMTECFATWPGMRITTQALDDVLGTYKREDHTLASMNADFIRRLAVNAPPPSSLDEQRIQSTQLETSGYLQPALAIVG